MSRANSTVDRILTAMAYNREAFKDRVEEKLGGALLEHYKATLGRLNRQTRWVQHWAGEAERLINIELAVVLLHSIKGFRDRKKAVREVLQHLADVDHQYRRAAERNCPARLRIEEAPRADHGCRHGAVLSNGAKDHRYPLVIRSELGKESA
jgi:hypothetical protein